MKYLLVFLVVLLVAWKWRSARTADHAARQNRRAAAAAAPTEMVPCTHCGVHIPGRDAVTGLHGVYCSNAHRNQAES